VKALFGALGLGLEGCGRRAVVFQLGLLGQFGGQEHQLFQASHHVPEGFLGRLRLLLEQVVACVAVPDVTLELQRPVSSNCQSTPPHSGQLKVETWPRRSLRVWAVISRPIWAEASLLAGAP
jgi:hypothetical protein